MAEIDSKKRLVKTFEAFKNNPNRINESLLKRAMRIYQCNVTALEPAGAGPVVWPPFEEPDIRN